MTTTIIDADRRGSPSDLVQEYTEFGTLIRYLAMRDLRLRYRHASLGALWVILQPLLPMLIFVGIFSRVLRPSSGDVPYSLLVLSGMVPWTFFAASVSYGCMTFVSNANLLNKVYMPRAILPASAILGSSVDLGVGCLLLSAYAIWLGYWPHWNWLVLPFFALQAIVTAFFVSLGLATLNAIYRDVKHAMQFMLQLWLYATPVVYSPALISPKYRWLLGLNPMTSVVEGFRWAVLGIALDWQICLYSLASTMLIAVGALVLFRHFERSLAERV
jgi:homopolymeric O-antigen transport system permease protein